jgi:hypothetical protein
MDHRQLHHGSLKAISILDPVDVETAYSYSASHHHGTQSHVRSYGCRYASFGQREYPMEKSLILRCEECVTKAVQILYRSYCNDRPSSHFSTYPRSLLEATIVQEVGQGNGSQS